MTEIELCIMWAHRAQSVAEQPQVVRFYKLCETALRAQQEQPNEALTCEGCSYQKREAWNYENCIRCKRHWDDRYHRANAR